MTNGPLRRLWHAWKALRLPWRKKYLAGTDLAGRTYWQLKPHANSPRPRRMVQPGGGTHLSDVQVSPQWHQWLRYTRPDPPSVQEQERDLQRLASLKQLARLADERWASKPSLLDGPPMQQQQQQQPALETVVKDPAAYAQLAAADPMGAKNTVRTPDEMPRQARMDLAQERTPAEGRHPWQPRAWEPKPTTAPKA